MSRPVRNATGVIRERTALVIEVVTDSGHSGWGETQRHPSAAWGVVAEHLGRGLLGTDPLDTVRVRPTDAGPPDELSLMAESALDIALWDLRGRILETPVSSLLGGAVRSSIRAYASGPVMVEGDDPYRDMVTDSLAYVEDGFRGLKLRCGVSPGADASIVASVRDAVGDDIALMIDLNAGYSRIAASDLTRRLADSGLGWIEEPIDPFDVEGYARLTASSSVPIAAGESLAALSAFRDAIVRGGVSLIQPDLYLCGGFTGALAIAALAEAHGVPLLPHVFGSAVNFAASLQLAAVLPASRQGMTDSYPWFEVDRSDNPLRSFAIDVRPDVDGFIPIPHAPGIGLDVDRERLEPFARRVHVLDGA